jgi:hypothetical protein
VHSLDRDVRFAAELSVGRVFTDCPLSSAITVGGVSPHTPGRGRTICENVIVPDEGSIEVICVPWRINRYLSPDPPIGPGATASANDVQLACLCAAVFSGCDVFWDELNQSFL